MPDNIFDHEKPNVDRLAIEYVAHSFEIAKELLGFIVTLAISGCEPHNRSHSISPKAMASEA